MKEMKREHPASPRTGVGVFCGFLFLSHRRVMTIQIRDAAIAIQESVRIFELKTILSFTWFRIAIAHPSAGKLIK